ncbi:reverse transcriptase domain-containing protein [Tanacetum coccineum]
MPVELGSFDAIIGMDWLANHHAMIVCDEKIVRIPYGDEVLIVQGDRGSRREKSKLSIISFTKTHKYVEKGCLIFLAQVTKKEIENKSKERRLEDVPTIKDFPEVFPEDLPGLPPTRQSMPNCQVHKPIPRNPQQKLTPITSLWPFYKLGIDIARPFPEGPRKVKFLIVAMDYFTKWIEAKPVATITGNQIKKFIWDNIVCRFRLLGEIISDNGKQFRDDPFKDWTNGLRREEQNRSWVKEFKSKLKLRKQELDGRLR